MPVLWDWLRLIAVLKATLEWFLPEQKAKNVSASCFCIQWRKHEQTQQPTINGKVILNILQY